MTQTKMKIETMIAADYNPRVMLYEEMQKLKRSLLRFGHAGIIVINTQNNHIVGGNQTIDALKQLGDVYRSLEDDSDLLEQEAGENDVEELRKQLLRLAKETKEFTEVDAKAYNLSDEEELTLNLALNQIHGTWDFPKLNSILETIEESGMDVKLTGFEVDLKPLDSKGPKKFESEKSELSKDLDNILDEGPEDDLFFNKSADDANSADIVNRLSNDKIQFKLELKEDELKTIRRAVVEYNKRREATGNINYGKTLYKICKQYLEGLK